MLPNIIASCPKYKSALLAGPYRSTMSVLMEGKKSAFGTQPSHLCVPFGVHPRGFSHTGKVGKASPGC